MKIIIRSKIMNKIISIVFVVTSLYGQAFDISKVTYYGGIHSNNISTSGFANFHLSDWETYGLKNDNSSNAEGRVNVPLGDKDITGNIMGIYFGSEYPMTNRINSLVELQVGLGKVTYGAAFLGIEVNVIKKDKFSLGIMPKIGGGIVSADFGSISLIDGYQAPVIIPEGTFTDGDSLSMEIIGTAFQIGITPSYKINDKISITGQAGYSISSISESTIKVNDEVEIPLDATGVVKVDYTGTHADLNPTADTGGIYFQFGIRYKMGK